MFFRRYKHKLPMPRWWRRYGYKHTTIALIAIALFVYFFDSAIMASIFSYLVSLDYIGGLLAGVMCASFFTVAPAIVLIIDLAARVDPLILALVIGFGNAIGDLIILLIFEEHVFDELKPALKRFKSLQRYLRARKRRSPAALLIGILFIVTPLPDEVGVGALGLSRFPQFIVFIICWGLNIIGAAMVILGTRLAG